MSNVIMGITRVFEVIKGTILANFLSTTFIYNLKVTFGI